MDPATPTPVTEPTLQERLFAELKRSNDLKEAALKAAPVVETKAAPVATQTDDQALRAELTRTAERLKAAEDREAEYRELESRLKKYETEHTAKVSRASELSLADAADHIRGTLGICKAATVDAFRSLDGVARHSAAEYRRIYGALNPLEAIIRGAMVPESGATGYVRFTPAMDDPLVREVRDLNDGVLIWRAGEKAAGRDYSMDQCPLWSRHVAAQRHLYQAVVGKALDTADTSNFVPTGFSAELIYHYDLARNVTKKIRGFQVPRFPFNIPGNGAAITMYAIAEQTADAESATAVTTSDPVDRATAFTRHRLGARTNFSYDLEADSIIPTAQWAREELGRGLGIAEEEFVVDGDTATFHMDTNVTGPVAGSTSVKRQVLGLRAWAVDQGFTNSLATFTTTTLIGMIEDMNKYASNPTDCCWIGPARVRAKMLGVANTGGYPMVIGSNAAMPATSGNVNMVNQFLGMDFVVMETFLTNMNASGFYDGTTTNTTGVLLVNHRRWGYAYDNLAPVVETMRWPRTQQVEIVVTVRRDFLPLDATTEHIVDYGIAVAT